MSTVRIMIAALFACYFYPLFALNDHKPDVLIVVYMAARNDLSIFVGQSLKQLKTIGSTDRVKIFVRLDVQKQEEPPVTKHFFIDQHKIMQIGPDINHSSGDEESLIDTVRSAYERFPAQELVLVLWSHATGPIEPDLEWALNPSELYTYHDQTRLVEFNRSTGFFDGISLGKTVYAETKGIAFDDTYGNFLTIEKLTKALRVISEDVIKKKIKILACDACFMAGADVFIGLQPYVHYYVASEEAERGVGYKYDKLLEPLIKDSMKCDDAFAAHFVSTFKETHGKITQEYTHSAIDLTDIDLLAYNLDELAAHLIYGIEHQKGKTVREALRLSKHKNYCTHFIEPTFIDLGHFYDNLLKNASKCQLENTKATKAFREKLSELLTQGLRIINKVVIANVSGKSIRHASGISIYFPQFLIHKSYYNNSFANKTNWLSFLKKYMNAE